MPRALVLQTTLPFALISLLPGLLTLSGMLKVHRSNTVDSNWMATGNMARQKFMSAVRCVLGVAVDVLLTDAALADDGDARYFGKCASAIAQMDGNGS